MKKQSKLLLMSFAVAMLLFATSCEPALGKARPGVDTNSYSFHKEGAINTSNHSVVASGSLATSSIVTNEGGPLTEVGAVPPTGEDPTTTVVSVLLTAISAWIVRFIEKQRLRRSGKLTDDPLIFPFGDK